MLTAFSCAQKPSRSDVPIIFPLLPQSKQRKPPKIRVPFEPPAQRKKTGTGEPKDTADDAVEEVDFFLCVDMSVPMRRKGLT